MANKKKKKANRPRAATTPAATVKNVQGVDVESENAEEIEPAPKSKKVAKGSGKDKVVIKSQARAKDPNKASKKPNIFRRFIEYIKQVRIEIKRTTWPTQNEVLNMTIIVIVALLFFGVFIFIIDFIMVEALNLYSQLAPDASAVDASTIDASAVDTSATDIADTSTTGTESAETDLNGGE